MRFESLRFSSAISILLLSFVAVGCGSSYKTTKVKNYTLSVVNNDPRLKAEFKDLIDDFNRFTGSDVLNYVENPEEANSAIILTKGLKQRDGKVGWGQWLSETKSDSPVTTPGNKPKRKISYSMRLEFDLDYYTSRLQSTGEKETIEKQKLFFHEVGHGLEMDHVTSSESNVMYPDISGDKNFSLFFEQVRSYMADQ